MKYKEKPADLYWTDDQWKAIAASGNNILVAAAAGSGKTAVLVERIIRKIVDTESKTNVDSLLVVTFTNAAAAEMRHRIGEKIEEKLKDDPTSLHLRRQLSLLNRANISTLHAFCMKTIRQYYYDVNIDPSFRILDDIEGVLIREEIIESLFEEEYGKENNTAFFDVVDRFSSDRSDDKLRTLILKLYNFSMSHPDPHAWLDQMARDYDVDEEADITELPWAKEVIKDIEMKLEGALSQLDKGLELTREPAGPARYGENLDEDIIYVNKLLAQTTWNERYLAFEEKGFGRLKSISKNDLVDKDLQEQVKAYRTNAKEAVEKIKKEFFSKDPKVLINDIRHLSPAVSTIVQLVKDFSKRYMEEKKEKAVLDFNDLEHFALAILGWKDESGNWLASRAARQYQEQFTEVLVDEYQDTNLVQETILSLVSSDSNRFMVGDVKQSIYRFRLAEPSLFLEKHKSYVKAGEGEGWRIDLSKNFRSRKEVLDATNYIFRQIMDEGVGEIVYDENAELYLGNLDYPEQEALETEVALINKGLPDNDNHVDSESSEDEIDFDEDLETSQMEARYMIKEIKKALAEKYPVYDKKLKTRRPIEYRDIVILMRSMPWAATIMDEFKKEGIPIYADLSTGYFEAVEVQVMLSLLKVIDNPFQDIPVAAVLRSPIYRFDEQQLAHVRIMDKDHSYYEALKKAALDSPDERIREKSALFLKRLERWRTMARSGALSELIWELYRETGYFDYVGGLPGGKQRQANLRALYDRARVYEETSFRGLFRFLRFIDRMEERGDDLGTARALGEQEDVVRIMTIHKSKGLEFPVVFVAGVNKKFNMMDLHQSYLLHKDLGFGSKYIDPTLRVEYPTIPQLAIKTKMHLEALAEEMRVLYVALTRAKEKLFIVGSIDDVEKSIVKWKDAIHEKEWLLPAIDRQKGKSYLDWIGPAIMRHKQVQATLMPDEEVGMTETAIFNDPSMWQVKIVEQEALQLVERESDQADEKEVAILHNKPVHAESVFKDVIKKRLEWQYDYLSATRHPSKQTVSELKRELTDEYSENIYSSGFQSAYADRPRFLQKEELTAAETGTVMHSVMQHIPLNELATRESIEKHLFLMVEKELLTKEEAEVIDVEQILAFFETELGKRLLNAEWVKKELPFSLGIPASRTFQSWEGSADETVLIQGVIDCIFKDQAGKLVLIDYKTDSIHGRFPGGFEEATPILDNRYRMQISLYVEALEASWNEKLDEAHLFFFDGSHVMTMKGDE